MSVSLKEIHDAIKGTGIKFAEPTQEAEARSKAVSLLARAFKERSEDHVLTNLGFITGADGATEKARADNFVKANAGLIAEARAYRPTA